MLMVLPTFSFLVFLSFYPRSPELFAEEAAFANAKTQHAVFRKLQRFIDIKSQRSLLSLALTLYKKTGRAALLKLSNTYFDCLTTTSKQKL